MQTHLARLLLLLLPLLAAAQQPSTRGLLKPPANFRFVQRDGHPYYRGTVSLDAHADTARLAPFGFRNLAFAGRGFRCVKYDALWPRDLPLDSLPPQVSGIEYDAELATRPAIYVFFGKTPTMKMNPNHMGTYAQALRDGRCRYALPKDPAGDIDLDGRPYVIGQVALWEAADTTALKNLGFRDFVVQPEDPDDRFNLLPPAHTTLWTQIQFYHCRYPARLDLTRLPDSVLDLACNSELRRNGLNPNTIGAIDLVDSGW